MRKKKDDGRMTFLGVGVGAKLCARLVSAESRR